MTKITAARLREVLEYDQQTGLWRWLKPQGNNRKRGWFAGSVTVSGSRRHTKTPRLRMMADNKQYYAHVLAHLYMTGEWPRDRVDHRDLDGLNNRWTNLRPATRSQNEANKPGADRPLPKGVSVARGRFVARIQVEGTAIRLGIYDTPELAQAAYAAAANENFGEFARAS